MQAMNAGRWRQMGGLALGLAALLGAVVLAACGENRTAPDSVTSGTIQASRDGRNFFLSGNSFAGVAADESRAAEVGRDVMLGGGNAIDAAVAMYFAQAVTLPSASSLGASGVCIAHNQKTRVGEVFGFPPIAAPGPVRGVAISVPAGSRAVTLMHIRHGQARFEQIIAPAERLARYGIPVSRALARDLRAAAGPLSADSEARRIFTKGTGAGLAEGENLVQSDLAGVIGALRQSGGLDLVQGRYGRVLSDQITQMGGSMPLETIRNAAPVTGTPPGVDYAGHRVYVAPPPFAGAAALAAWNGQAAPAGGTTGDSAGFSSLIAVDSNGNAAACTMSMGQLFGARLVVPGTGVALGSPTADAAAVSPLVIGSPNNGEFLFAGAAGGSTASAAIIGAIARVTVRDSQPVQQVLAARAAQGGYANVVACPRGLRGNVGTCNGGTDPGGFGLALPAIPVR
jgi:gamma-glutamyltranspeptidase/glutathione hydrolase